MDNLLLRFEQVAECTIEEFNARQKSPKHDERICNSVTEATTRFPHLDSLSARLENLKLK